MPTFRGILIPLNWDNGGEIIAIALSTVDEEEYMIDDNAKGREMLEFIRKEVEVSGVIREEKDGKKIIVVNEYRLL